MTTLLKILSLFITFTNFYAYSMKTTSSTKTDLISDSRLLLELPDEILGTVIKYTTTPDKYQDTIYEATKTLIRTSWLCEKFKTLSEPNKIKAVLSLNQKMIQDTFSLYALYTRCKTKPMPDLTPFFKILIAMGADTSYFSDLYCCICTTNNTYLIEHYIINHKPDINIQDHHNETPLCLAVNLKYANVVDLLLAHGADMYLTDKIGMTPTDSALLHDNIECLKVLINHGVDISIAYKRGENFKQTIAKWAKLGTSCNKQNTDDYNEIYKLVTGEDIQKSWDEKSVSELLNDTCLIS